MANKNKGLTQFFLVFWLETVISGIYLIFKQDYISGISGASVGVLLIYLNRKHAKESE